MTKAGTITNSYKKGDLLLEEQPFVFILKSSLRNERCDHCLQKSELFTCSGCNLIRYCDRFCQKKGWGFHKNECKKMKRIAPRTLPDSARMLARIIFKLEKGGAREQGFYSPRQFRVFMDLMSHYNEIKKDVKRMDHFESLYAVLETFFYGELLPNSIELLRIYGKMVVNTFCILDSEMQAIGSGIYLAASILDHSCNPNAVAVFNGTTLNIRTQIEVKNLDWTKVFLSYIDLLNLPQQRQKELEETYYFLCQCQRCLDIEELNLMTATLCQNDECGRQIKGGTMRPDAKCDHCGESVDKSTWEDIFNYSNFIDEQLISMKDMAYLDVCRLCLQKQEGLFDPMNIRRIRLLDLAMDCCIEMNLWEAAVEYGRELITPFRFYYGQSHPLTGILLMKLGKIAMLLNKLEDARKWLKEAADVLIYTHGKGHPLVRGELLTYIRECTGSSVI